MNLLFFIFLFLCLFQYSNGFYEFPRDRSKVHHRAGCHTTLPEHIMRRNVTPTENLNFTDETRTIWILWAQDWENAPVMQREVYKSWRDKNPSWHFRPLNAKQVRALVDFEYYENAFPNLEWAAKSDIIRLLLLAKYGGIWVDASLACVIPLDEWIHNVTSYTGLFLFSREPKEFQITSSWFIAATHANHPMINAWLDLTNHFLHNQMNDKHYHYYWVHKLFNLLFDQNKSFQSNWYRTPFISAGGPHCAKNAKSYTPVLKCKTCKKQCESLFGVKFPSKK